MSKKIVLLGATGSIGTQALSLLKGDDEYELVGISANKNVDRVLEILAEFPSVGFVAMAIPSKAKAIKEVRPDIEVFSGDAANINIIDEADPDVVLNSILGFSGFLPSLHTLRKNKILLLANKETMVVGGKFINEELSKGNGKVYPIDSEHVALAKCLADSNEADVKELYITASGGALRDYPVNRISMAPVKAVLEHPTWKMGAKITVDSATMVNKAYEVIEASMLFNRPISDIKAYIERNSLIHGGVVLNDGTKIYEYSPNTMLIPIEYALSLGTIKRHVPTTEELSDIEKIQFEPIDNNRYPMFAFILDFVKRYPERASIIVNAVDEVVVNAYLEQKIRLGDLETILRKVSSSLTRDEKNPKELRDVIELDMKARKEAEHMVDVFANALANGNNPSLTISKPVRDASKKHSKEVLDKEERRKEKKASRWKNDPTKKTMLEEHKKLKAKKKKAEKSNEKKSHSDKKPSKNNEEKVLSFEEYMKGKSSRKPARNDNYDHHNSYHKKSDSYKDKKTGSNDKDRKSFHKSSKNFEKIDSSYKKDYFKKPSNHSYGHDRKDGFKKNGFHKDDHSHKKSYGDKKDHKEGSFKKNSFKGSYKGEHKSGFNKSKREGSPRKDSFKDKKKSFHTGRRNHNRAN